MVERLIRRLCYGAGVKAEYVKALVDNVEPHYAKAFTDSSFDKLENYEVFEFIGDSTINNFIPWYFLRRFPKFDCPRGVKTLARLKINASSKSHFYRLATSHGFWPLIRAADAVKTSPKGRINLLENVFEAFFGATQYILDKEFVVGLGYAVCYDILKSLFDEIEFSLETDELYDAITRLKEFVDKNPSLAPVEYVERPTASNEPRTTVYVRRELLGEGEGATKAERKKMAAAQALAKLVERGHSTTKTDGGRKRARETETEDAKRRRPD